MKNVFTLIFLGIVIASVSVGPENCASAQTVPVGPKLWIESRAIDLGKITVDQEQIEGVVRYMNEGDETLEISGIYEKNQWQMVLESLRLVR